MTACNGISGIVVERNRQNGAKTDPKKYLPTILPAELVRLTPRRFLNIARAMSSRLDKKYSAGHIDIIGDQQKEFVRAYKEEPMLKAAIDGAETHLSFHNAWAPLAQRITDLQNYFGGIATVFPGKSNVESDFSILRWEKNRHRKSLSGFGLEDVMQSKQYERLEAVAAAL